MSYEITRNVYVELGGVPLATPAFECLDPMTLAAPASRRGQDRVIAGAAGVRAKRRRKTVTRRTITVVVAGHPKWDGSQHSAGDTGLQSNLDHIYAALLPTDGDPITATVHKPGGSTVTGPVQIEDIETEYHGDTDAVLTIDISIPGGELS